MKLAEAKNNYCDALIANIIDKEPIILTFNETDIDSLELENYNNYKTILAELKEKFIKIETEYSTNQINLMKMLIIELHTLKRGKRDKYIFFSELTKRKAKTMLTNSIFGQFENIISVLDKRIDFFCSYTRKGVPGINNSYCNAICKQYPIKSDHPEWEKENYLAKMIVRYLNDLNYRGFFDSKSLVTGEEIKGRIKDYCSNTNVFIQILEQETFREDEDEINWCKKEYEFYKNAEGEVFIFYKKPDLVAPQGDDDLINWFNFSNHHVLNRILEKEWDHERVRYQVYQDEKIIEKQRDKFIKMQLDKIRNLKNNLITPSSS